MEYEIKVIREQDWDRFFEVVGVAFGEGDDPDEGAAFRRVAETERMISAYEGDNLTSTGGAFTFDMTVPGGSTLPAPGVTIIGVLPTHRRRGILAAMMRHQMEDFRARNEPLAILWASESSIYQRFGYGMAAPVVFCDIERDRSQFLRPEPAIGRPRLVSKEEALLTWPSLYDELQAKTPGMYKRSEEWWASHTLFDSATRRSEAGEQYCVVWEQNGDAEAYVRYRIKGEWTPAGAPYNQLTVREIVAANPIAYREIWRYVFGVDLVGRIKAHNQPIDNPLLYMLAEPRRLQATITDGLWLRVVDVQGALEGRAYESDGELTFELIDEFCPWNSGPHTLQAKSGEARVTEAAGEVELTFGAAELGTCYLGGGSFDTLRRAGRVVEHTPGAARRADELFKSSVKPHCPEVF